MCVCVCVRVYVYESRVLFDVFDSVTDCSVDLLIETPMTTSLSPPQNEYMKDNFLIKIETWHKPDTGHLENVIKDSNDLLMFVMFLG